MQLPADVFDRMTTRRTATSSWSTPSATSARTRSSSASSQPKTSLGSPATSGSTTTPKRRAKPRTTPEGTSLPPLLRLRSLKVTQKTLDSYHRHVRDFEAWAKAHKHRVTKHNLDGLGTLYLNFLAEDNDNEEIQPSVGAYVIYGLQLLRNEGPKRDFLPNAKEALSGWKKLQPGGMRLPVPEEFVYDLGLLALHQQRGDLAFAVALQYDTYMRPSELLGLTLAHLGFPAGGRYNKWSIAIAFRVGRDNQAGDL